MRLQHLKVTAHLVSPICGDVPMLDSLLEWVMSFHMASIVATSNGHRHRIADRPRGEPVERPGAIPIPIARRQLAGVPVPLCSAPLFRADLDTADHLGKRLEIESCDLLDGSGADVIPLTSGAYKSYYLPLRVRVVPQVVWFCSCRWAQRGSPAPEVRRLLKRVDSIGKKTSIGYGQVARWEVEIIDRDLSWFAPHEDGQVLMRPLPVGHWLPGDLLGYRRDYGGYTPPYWQRSFWSEIVVPC